MNNCIVYLVKNTTEEIEKFNISFNSVFENLLSALEQEVDVIIFHEYGFPTENLQVKKYNNIIFFEVDFKLLPSGLKSNQISLFFPHPTHGNGPIGFGHPGFDIGYRQMCRFFSGEIYRLDIMSKYKYYLRLDCDSQILSKLNFDIFCYFEQRHGYFGYIEAAIQVDDAKTCFGFYDTAMEFLKNRGSFADQVRNKLWVKKNGLYYSNFEMGYLPWFTSEKYLSYYEHIDKSFGFLTNRWGDHIVKYFAVRSFLPKKRLIAVRGFIYKHGAVYDNSSKKSSIFVLKIKKIYEFITEKSFRFRIST